MTFLNTIPLIGAIVACLLGILILSNKNQNKSARLILGVIVFLNAHNLFESFLYYNDLNWPGLGISYLHYHLIGALFLFYTHKIFRLSIRFDILGWTDGSPETTKTQGYTLFDGQNF